jgi:two-component system chemotaxis sensor kinase CheA
MAKFLKGEDGGASAKKAEVSTDEIFAPDEPEDMLTYKVTYTDECQMPSARAMVQ